ncbi:uncharacterized protein [Arachis hypogaea]|uniref:uncharacterized protein n=1 Tax=Arachis hypogaea TaxID=3818 RepID=UPI003B21E095
MISCGGNLVYCFLGLILKLLCQYKGGSVLKFLEKFDSYCVEHCLHLCQQYGIIDTAAFLPERVGDVGRSSLFEHVLWSLIRPVNEMLNLLRACIGLRPQNTPRLNPEEAEAHWFLNYLTHKININMLFLSCSSFGYHSDCEPLMDSNVEERPYERKDYFGMLDGSENSPLDNESYKSRWKISKSHNGHIMRKLLSQFIKEIVEGLIGFVHLPTIMSKLLSDNRSQEFGDYKFTILGMLVQNYVFLKIHLLKVQRNFVLSCFHKHGNMSAMSLLKKGASQRNFTLFLFIHWLTSSVNECMLVNNLFVLTIDNHFMVPEKPSTK